MKKFLIIAGALLLTSACSAQLVEGQPPSAKVGFNNANTSQVILTPEDYIYFDRLTPPGGTFSWRDRYDKLNENPSQIVGYYAYLQESGRGFTDIFVATDSGGANADAIRELKAGGIPIPVAEFVNEAFYPAGGYNFEWKKYQPALNAFINEVQAIDPNIRIGIPIAPKPDVVFTKDQGGNKLHSTWNNAAFHFMDSLTAARPSVKFSKIIHIYYTGAFVPAMGVTNTTDETGKVDKITAPTRRVYDYRTDTTDEKYWRDIYRQSIPSVFWEPILNYLTTNAPAATTYVTETGYIAAGKLNGSWTFAAKAFELTNLYGADPRIESFNWHGGFTESRVGVVSPRAEADVRDPESDLVSTATFDAFALYFHAGIIYKYRPELQLTTPGKYSLWYLNDGPDFIPTINTADGLQHTYTVQCITGTRYSALSTTTDATKKGSLIGLNEVSGILSLTNCPRFSFGYVEVTVTKIPVIGCRDPLATNYNAEADQDAIPSSCIYQPPPEPEICYKKRWLFSGCKIDRSCRTNNCTPPQSSY